MGIHLGRTSNMFLRYDFDVHLNHYVGMTLTRLIVRIDPPKQTVQEWLQANMPDRSRVTSLFDADRPYIRKAQMTFGWDNCPYLVSGGIPRPVWLESRQDVVLDEPGMECVGGERRSKNSQTHLDMARSIVPSE